MENLRQPESYLRDVLPDNPEFVLDVGIDRICDNISLPFDDEEYDVVQCCEVIEHILPEKWDKLINELCRVSKDLIYITTSSLNMGHEFFKYRGFHILFISPQHIIAFKRKISTWDSNFYDMDHYVKLIGHVESVIDVGTGKKGVVAQDYYENDVHIKKGYACDIWVLKELLPIWQPLKMNALDLLNALGQKSVDIVQAFGFLEHLEKSDGFKFLDIAERIARKAVIISAATFVHGTSPDEKALMDGNPYHRYNSVWHWKEFENLGYKSNFEDMRKGLTFSEEAIAWKIL
ncbi:class I SAM-dependent methyltransferase [Patescibacteria group bacterium]|nr:class I SAM-dependent methyltransferase [Patescibacteria group bacterium]